MIPLIILATFAPTQTQQHKTPPVVVRREDKTDRLFRGAEQRMRTLWNRKAFGQMYDEGSLTLKNGVTRARFIEVMTAFEVPLGAYERSTIQSVRDHASGKGRVMFFRTDYKRAAFVDEQISFEFRDGIARLAGYSLKPSSIRSRD